MAGQLKKRIRFGQVIGTVAGVLLQGVTYALRVVIWNLSLLVRGLAVVCASPLPLLYPHVMRPLQTCNREETGRFPTLSQQEPVAKQEQVISTLSLMLTCLLIVSHPHW